MIKAIVFDVGGVLLRTEDASKRRLLENRYGLAPNSVEKLVFDSKSARDSTIGLADTQNIWQEIAEKLDLSPRALQEFMEDFWEGDRLDKTLLEYLKNCRPSYTTALLSNAWTDARQAFANKFGIVEKKTVDHIIISAEEGVAKPDERIYQILSEKIGYEYEQILFIDDFLENIQAAENLGMHTIHYQPNMDLINTIESILGNEITRRE
jgi:epoxide hydrolase-like predicted phosphatase